MVLLSEFLVTGSAIIFLNIYIAQLFQDAARDKLRGRNYAILYAGGMLSLYSASRLLLETESPQSVIPGFIIVVFIIGEILKRGTYYKAEFFIHMFTILVVSECLLLFAFFKGLGFLSERAKMNILDRELAWYHTILIVFSSYRWILVIFIICIPVFKRNWGWLIMLARIGGMWAIWHATGSSVAKSPWGALDEILLERNSLLYLIMSLLTIAIITDQVGASIEAHYEDLDNRTGSKTEQISFDEIKTKLLTKISLDEIIAKFLTKADSRSEERSEERNEERNEERSLSTSDIESALSISHEGT